MVQLLARIFIANPEKVQEPAVRRAYGTLCGGVGLLFNLLLCGAKFFAGAVTGSVAIAADAVNNLSDAASAVIALLGFVLADKHPDPDHPFGHGRAEYLAGVVLAFFILFMGVELAIGSVQKILHPLPLHTGLLPALILLGSILVKLYMAFYNRRIGRLISSTALKATAVDSLSDAAATLVVLLSMGAAHFLQWNIDGWAGLAVAVFVLLAGWKTLRETLSPLLGQAPDPQLVAQVTEIVLSYPEVVGIHDMIIHDYGPGRLVISLHAEVLGNGNIFDIHDAVDCAENELRRRTGCLAATIHMDPIEPDNTEVARMREQVARLVTRIHPQLTIHDFRMVPGPSHTNLIFDVVMPRSMKMTEAALEEEIKKLVGAQWPSHHLHIGIDRTYT